jgi:hypothetical protein
MSKRDLLGVLVLLTGGLLCTAMATLPFGLALLAGGGYLLALPHLARWQGDRELPGRRSNQRL